MNPCPCKRTDPKGCFYWSASYNNGTVYTCRYTGQDAYRPNGENDKDDTGVTGGMYG